MRKQYDYSPEISWFQNPGKCPNLWEPEANRQEKTKYVTEYTPGLPKRPEDQCRIRSGVAICQGLRNALSTIECAQCETQPIPRLDD